VRRHALPALAAFVLAACGGSTPQGPVVLDPTTPVPLTTAPPTGTPSASPGTPTPTVTPSPTPTTPPPPTGVTVSAAGAFLGVAAPDQPRKVPNGADCSTVFPDITGPKCGALTLDGGSALWVTGRVDGVAVVRVLTQADAGYVTRYAGREGGSKWAAVNAWATPLTGRGADGLVVTVRLRDGALTYDVLTWVKGGPLVLRAHRPPLADGRLAPRDGRLDEYALVPDGRYARRIVAWDGRYFRVSSPSAVDAGRVPPR
jgi:hypothetical protein